MSNFESDVNEDEGFQVGDLRLYVLSNGQTVPVKLLEDVKDPIGRAGWLLENLSNGAVFGPKPESKLSERPITEMEVLAWVSKRKRR